MERGERDGGLMLLLAYLWTQNEECRDSRIRLLRVVEKEAARQQNEQHLLKLVKRSRIKADVKVVVSQDPWTTLVPDYSRNSDVVFLGLSVPEAGGGEAFIQTFQPLLDQLSTTVMVDSIEKLDIQL